MVHSAHGQEPSWAYHKVQPWALLFNIYLNDLFMFLEETEICNYADDTIIYACGPNTEDVIMHLEMMPLR